MLNQEEAQMGETRIIIKGIQGFDEKISREPHTGPGDASKPGGVGVSTWPLVEKRLPENGSHPRPWVLGVPWGPRSQQIQVA